MKVLREHINEGGRCGIALTAQCPVGYLNMALAGRGSRTCNHILLCNDLTGFVGEYHIRIEVTIERGSISLLSGIGALLRLLFQQFEPVRILLNGNNRRTQRMSRRNDQ